MLNMRGASDVEDAGGDRDVAEEKRKAARIRRQQGLDEIAAAERSDRIKARTRELEEGAKAARERLFVRHQFESKLDAEAASIVTE